MSEWIDVWADEMTGGCEVLYVPETPGGELAAALRAYEKKRDCFPCKPGAGEGAVKTCGTCSVNGVRKVFWVETSHTLYQRGKEHRSAYLSESDKSALHMHCSLEHPQHSPDWKIRVYNHHQRHLRRQVESVNGLILVNISLTQNLHLRHC